MSVKKTRLDVLRYLLGSKRFDNQEDLLKDLRSQGFDVAQPTLSRDLHYLKVSKVFDAEGKSVYTLPHDVTMNQISVKHPKEKLTQSFGFLLAKFSGNLMVLKTLHGYASSLAAEIDNYTIPEILASLAGDDTVLLVLKENADRNAILDLLKKIIPRFSYTE